MKVWELIQRLSKMPAGANVLFQTRIEKDGDFMQVYPEFDEESLTDYSLPDGPWLNIYVVHPDFE